MLGATGFIGSPYRREIRDCPDDATIVSLCGRRLELLKAAAVEDGAEYFTNDWEEAISDDGVNLVLVCTPDSLHHEAIMACAERGLHVVCEKPPGVTAAEANQMWNAYRDRQPGHFVPLWTRYVDVFRKAREICAAGQLGPIRAFVYRWHNPRPVAMPFTWRDDAVLSSAGSIGDVGSHAYDALRWILGDETKRVLTHADVVSPAKPDLGDINLGEAIAWGSEHNSPPATKRRKGSAYDYASISIDRVSGDVRLYRNDVDPETVATLPEAHHRNRFNQFAFPGLRDRIDGRPSEHPGLDDGYRVQLFTEAAARSARDGHWIDLSQVENQLT